MSFQPLYKKFTKELETHGLWLWVLWWFLRQFLCGLLRFPDVHCVKYNGVNFIMKYVVNPHKAAEILANCWWDLRLGEGGGRSVQCTFSARPGKCQKSYTNKIVRKGGEDGRGTDGGGGRTKTRIARPKHIIKSCVKMHMNSNIHNEFPALLTNFYNCNFQRFLKTLTKKTE